MRYLLLSSLLILLLSCSSKKKAPDVSHISVELSVERFDRDFFSLDTLHLSESLDTLHAKYGDFLTDYLYNILGLPSQEDSVLTKVKWTIQFYKPLYDSVRHKYPDLKDEEKELKRALQYVHYYFPKYELPKHLITFVGPIEGYGNVLTSEGLAVGLQLYMGKDFSVYQSEYVRDVYPAYRSRRFESSYIVTDCIRNIILELYPYRSNSAPLIDQMIELGKRLYVLEQILPNTQESILTGYTQEQLTGCYENEAYIWNFFLKNDLLYSTEPALIHDYVTDGPKTPVLGEGSPGFIGQFTGWQIVKKWMEKQKNISLTELMNTPAKTILEEAKYKPR